MKKLILSFIFIIPLVLYAQEKKSLQSIINSVRDQVQVDSTAKEVLYLFDALFEEGLQANQPAYSEKTMKSIQELPQKPMLKNMHLFALFMMYQDHITQGLQSGQTNPAAQVEIMEVLIKETKAVYNKVPVILYIYQAEAYNAHKNEEGARNILAEARSIYPNAIPLKVYAYLNNKDEELKREIIQQHANHWLVKQFKIAP